MKNIFKRFITCTVAACLILATVFTSACVKTPDNGDNGGGDEVHTDPTKDGYTISVLYPDDTPVKGSDSPYESDKVTVIFVDGDGKDINETVTEVSETGVARISAYRVSGEFLIDVFNCPFGFDYVDKVHTVEGRGDYTVKLTAVKVSYTINVNLPDGTPANNVTVNVKQSGKTVASATTGSDGKAVISDIYAGNYDVEFTDLDEGISYLPTKLTKETTNVELIYLKEIKFDELMSEEKLDEWDKLANGPFVKRFDKTADCYDFETDIIPEGKRIYYYFTADKDGEYTFIARDKYYYVEFYGPSLATVGSDDLPYASSVHASTNTCEMMPLELAKGEKCYFSYSIPERSGNGDDHELSGTRNFMIAKPVASVKNHELIAPTHSSPNLNYTVTFEKDTAIVILKTLESADPENHAITDGGIFEICSHTSDYDVKIEYYPFLSSTTIPPEGEDDDSGEGKNFKYTLEVPPSEAGGTHYFKIIIKSKLDGGEVEYPVEIPIAITRTGNAEENLSPVEELHATATELYPDQSGKTFHFLLDGKNSISEDDFTITPRDGGYYVNIDGTEYELVIAISKNICTLPYSYATIEYMGGGDRGGSGSDELPSTPFESKQNNYLTLYADPAIGEDRTNPQYNYAPFIEEYVRLCNSDGVYKLNNELKEFAERYYNQRGQDFIYGLTLSKCCWLVSCGYYA